MFKTCKKPPMSIISASGSICTFNALQSGLPLKSHTVALTATQSGSGTPSPSSPLPIRGWDAINIGHNSTANIFGGIYLLNAFIKANISNFVYDTDNKTLRFSAPKVSDKIMYGVFKPNTQYTFYIVGENTQANKNTNIEILYSDGTITNIQWSDSLANTKQTRVITSTAGKTVVGLKGGNYAGVTTLYYDECGAIEGVKTIDDFVAFGGTSYLIQIGSTVYGGEYDARSGVLMVTHGFVDLGVVGYTQQSTDVVTLNKNNIQSATGLNPKRTNALDMLCSVFSTDNSTLSATTNGIRFYTDVLAENFASTFNGQQLVFELETTQIIQLPPCPIDVLEGQNNIFSDVGSTALEAIKIGR